MMKSKRGCLNGLVISLTLLVALDSQAGRDPFQPLQSGCEQLAFPFSWQLKGIIGQPDDFHAWLIASKGGWIQLSGSQPLDGRWQMLEITALSITFADISGCEPAFKRNLKGNIYEKDTLFVDPGGDSAPVTGR
ncbi:HofP DNA utilization family protein [Erwinia sp.]|uniref:HofP DNA utilization family protein n=1 Tax=Erwinia citreus TaxID=558 RepID=UPI003C70B063